MGHPYFYPVVRESRRQANVAEMSSQSTDGGAQAQMASSSPPTLPTSANDSSQLGSTGVSLGPSSFGTQDQDYNESKDYWSLKLSREVL